MLSPSLRTWVTQRSGERGRFDCCPWFSPSCRQQFCKFWFWHLPDSTTRCQATTATSQLWPDRWQLWDSIRYKTRPNFRKLKNVNKCACLNRWTMLFSLCPAEFLSASPPPHSLLHSLHPDRHLSRSGLLSVLVRILPPMSDRATLPGEVIVVRMSELGLPVLPSFK